MPLSTSTQTLAKPNRLTTIDRTREIGEVKKLLAAKLRILLPKIKHAFYIWRERARQRRALAQLSNYQLKDIGISRSDAINEASKPFWES